MKSVLFYFYLCLLACVCSCEDECVVELPKGSVKGFRHQSYKGRPFLSFEGIPFAKPPVGDLRFEPPQEPEPWNDILVANQTYQCLYYSSIKMFPGARGEEDCLYVNVYVPRETIDESANMSVLVHIHGGAFLMGAPKLMAKPDYIMDIDVVYVSMNYRLGLLGFLSTEDEVVPGNMGLKDQTLSLKWIQNNIKYFGGNPDSVTLTGLSAGGASVHLHYLSPLSKGLFHRGFSQSGTALQNWVIKENPLGTVKIIASHLDCDVSSTSEMVECLKMKKAKELVNGVTKVFLFMDGVPFFPFSPVVEKGPNAFLPDQPYKLLKEGKITDVPWITSNVRDEGIIPVGFIALMNVVEEIGEKWKQLGPYLLDLHETVNTEDMDEVLNRIRRKYIKEEKMTKDSLNDLVKLYSDRFFVCDSEKAIRLHASTAKSPVYYYVFNYLIDLPFLFPMERGVMHSDDGRLCFKMIFNTEQLSESDEAMMTNFIKFFEEYAVNGVPKFSGKDWNPIKPSSETLDYLLINGLDDISMNSTTQLCDQKFWDSLPIKENNKLFD